MKKLTFSPIVIGTVFCLLSFVFLSCRGGTKKGKNAGQARIYPIQTVIRGNATLESVFPVTLRGEEDAEIKPRVSGYIDKVFVDEGASVMRGQRLFSINSPSSAQELATAEANLATAIAGLATAKLDVERFRILAEKEIVSNTQLQSYENTYKTAEANKAKAEAAVKMAQETVNWTIVPSPIDGVVGTIAYRVGNSVTTATTLTTISKTANVYAYFSLNEKNLLELLNATKGSSQEEKIKNTPAVSLILADGKPYSEKGKISTISGVINTATGSVTIRAEFPNRNGLLKSGASGNISIPLTVENVFVIPQKATFSLQDKTVVYKAIRTKNEQDSTVQTIISVLPMPDGQTYAVTGGLTDGDRIITDGVATLRNGRIIKTMNEQ